MQKPSKSTLVAILLFLAGVSYCAVGLVLSLIQNLASPCAPAASNIPIRGGLLPRLVTSAAAWGPNVWRHLIQEDMPLRHFLLASDCQWKEGPPIRERVFKKGTAPCPSGTAQYKSDRCFIVPRRANVVAYRPHDGICPDGTGIGGSAGQCLIPLGYQPTPAAGEKPDPGEPFFERQLGTEFVCERGWVFEAEGLGRCRLPSLARVEGQGCPPGFEVWKPIGKSSIIPRIEVCRIKY